MNEYTKGSRIWRLRDAAGNEFKVPTHIERNDPEETRINAYIRREAQKAGCGGELCELVFSVNLQMETKRRAEETARENAIKGENFNPYGYGGKYW